MLVAFSSTERTSCTGTGGVTDSLLLEPVAVGSMDPAADGLSEAGASLPWSSWAVDGSVASVGDGWGCAGSVGSTGAVGAGLVVAVGLAVEVGFGVEDGRGVSAKGALVGVSDGVGDAAVGVSVGDGRGGPSRLTSSRQTLETPAA